MAQRWLCSGQAVKTDFKVDIQKYMSTGRNFSFSSAGFLPCVIAYGVVSCSSNHLTIFVTCVPLELGYPRLQPIKTRLAPFKIGVTSDIYKRRPPRVFAQDLQNHDNVDHDRSCVGIFRPKVHIW